MKIEFSIEKGRSIREDMFHQLGESCSFITTTDIFKKTLRLAHACAPFGFAFGECSLRSCASSVHLVSAGEYLVSDEMNCRF